MGQSFVMIDGERFFLVREGLLKDLLKTHGIKLAQDKCEIEGSGKGNYLANEMDCLEVQQIQNDLNAKRIQEYGLRGM